MKKYKILNLFVFALLSYSAYSQGGSNYTMFGVGDFKNQSGAFYEGLAGTGIAVPNKSGINFINPAMFTTTTKTRLQTGYKFNQQLVNAENASIAQNNGKIEGFSALFAIDTGSGATFAIGLMPYTSVNYLINSKYSIETEGSKINYNFLYQGSGGLTNAYVGFATKITEDLSLGALGIAHFGAINSSIKTLTSGYNTHSILDTNQYSMNGLGLKIGLSYKASENLLLGAFYEAHTKMDVTQKVSYSQYYEGLAPYNTVVAKTLDYKTVFPNIFGIGASYLTGKFLLCGDFTYLAFKDMDFKKETKFDYKDAFNLSFGVSRLGSQQIGAKFADQVTYNFGAGYKALYYKINGEPINEMFASFGFSAPIPQSALIDMAFTAGKRGTTDKKLLEEYFLRMSFSISLGETWFKPFYEEK